ncbi:MAG: DUF4062 domain-containing protein [Eubacteriales bacterium]|nr:DUF4062 domain-containing protein [Eubacteriales bacterium]
MKNTNLPDYISIFVSSTFRDMQTERDILRDKVVPILNEFAAQYGISVELIDLRWGINTKSNNENEAGFKVLRTCFDEIKRCQPYFIALLGDRYGWIPPYEQVCRAADGAGYTGAESDKSVTEMEIKYGALMREYSPSCLFYFRELDKQYVPRHARSDYFDMPENLTRLKILKDELIAKFPNKVRRYKARWDSRTRQVGGLDTFAQGVIDDIKAELTLRWGAVVSEHKSWQQREEAAWKRFFSSGKELTGREVESKYISDKLLREDARILVNGESGSGKSTLLCKIAGKVMTAGILLLPHSVGITDASFDTSNMLKMFIWRMEEFLQLRQTAEAVPDYETLKTSFQSLLAQCCIKTKVIFAIDGIDRLCIGEKAGSLEWLPLQPNGNISILLTADDKYNASEFKALGGCTIPIPPLYEKDIRCIIQKLARRYHKELDESVVLAMMQKKDGNGLPSARNPLFLNLSVQNLVMLDRYEFAEIEKLNPIIPKPLR